MKSKHWKDAMDAKMESITSNKTWDLCALQEGKKAMCLKWIYKSKQNAEGQVLKHREKVVAKGYSQKLGIDCDEVVYPVAWLETVRLVLALATHSRWKVF